MHLQECHLSSTSSNMGITSGNIAIEKQQNDERSSSRSRGWLNWLSLGMLGAGGTADSSQFSGVVSDEVIKVLLLLFIIAIIFFWQLLLSEIYACCLNRISMRQQSSIHCLQLRGMPLQKIIFFYLQSSSTFIKLLQHLGASTYSCLDISFWFGVYVCLIVYFGNFFWSF